MRTDIEKRKKEILNWIKENKSKAFISKQLKCKAITLDNWLKKFNIEYKGNKGGIGKIAHNKKTALEYSNSSFVHAHRLKDKLIEEGIKNKECEICKKKKWNKKDIPLELHHIDGNHFNNDFSNLQILCPNCHYQEEHKCAGSSGD